MDKKRAKALCRKTALLFLSLAILFSLSSCFTDSGSIASREEIETNIYTLSGVDLGYNYASSYLEEYGIIAFDKSKMRRAELYVYAYFLYELPPAYEVAESTVRLFLEEFYDSTELNDRAKVTDALLTCYMSSLGDRYAVYRNPEAKDSYHTDMSGSFIGIGVTVQNTNESTITVVELISGAAAERAGIQVGDLIIAVDGVTVLEAGYEATVNSIRGDSGTPVDITVERNGEQLTLTVIREKIVDELVTYSIDSENIGYIKITRFDGLSSDEDGTSKQLLRALNFMKENDAVGLILDLRGNPGGYLTSVIEALGYFVPENTPVVSYGYAGGRDTVISSEGGVKIDLPLTVICNEKTASAGELFCSALQDWSRDGLVKATLVGETTYGKGVMQSEFELQDGSILNFTTAYYNPPSGVNYNGVGVVPDVVASDSDSFDSQLDTAKEVLVEMIYKEGAPLSEAA